MNRIGFAKDIHRLVAGRPLYLGGVLIPFEKGLLGHSDADVVFHALSEAMLGALALGDLGKYFPDTDDKYANMSGSLLFQSTLVLIKAQHYHLGNADISIEAEAPKLCSYIDFMRENIAALAQTDITNISVKAGTREGLDSVGNGEAIEATAIVLLVPDLPNKQ